jgi:hypothetical protein
VKFVKSSGALKRDRAGTDVHAGDRSNADRAARRAWSSSGRSPTTAVPVPTRSRRLRSLSSDARFERPKEAHSADPLPAVDKYDVCARAADRWQLQHAAVAMKHKSRRRSAGLSAAPEDQCTLAREVTLLHRSVYFDRRRTMRLPVLATARSALAAAACALVGGSPTRSGEVPTPKSRARAAGRHVRPW